MKLAHSEVFQNLTNLLEEKGLVKNAQEEKTNPRYGSDDLETIELLYGVTPNGKDDDILDQAHPERVIISPAHDKMNGVVENLKERSNVMCGIALRPTRGLLTQEIYAKAHNELLESLLATGTLMDLKGEDKIAKFADSCSERLVNASMEKTAVVPIGVGAAVGIAAAVAAVAASLYAINNPAKQGVKQSVESALEEIDGAVGDYPQLAGPMSPLIKKLNDVKNITDKYLSYGEDIAKRILNIQGAETKEAKTQAIISQSLTFFESKKDEEVTSVLSKYKRLCDIILEMNGTAIVVLREAPSKYETSEPAFWTHVKTLWQDVILVSDVEDAARHLENLSKVFGEVSGGISRQISDIEKLKVWFDKLKSGTIEDPGGSGEMSNTPEADADMEALKKELEGVPANDNAEQKAARLNQTLQVK